jgi:hypothetical protein
MICSNKVKHSGEPERRPFSPHEIGMSSCRSIGSVRQQPIRRPPSICQVKLWYYVCGYAGVPGMKKKPSTSELLDWLKLLLVEDISVETLRERDPKRLIPPLHGALIKNEQDVHLFERLAFMARRDGR